MISLSARDMIQETAERNFSAQRFFIYLKFKLFDFIFWREKFRKYPQSILFSVFLLISDTDLNDALLASNLWPTVQYDDAKLEEIRTNGKVMDFLDKYYKLFGWVGANCSKTSSIELTLLVEKFSFKFVVSFELASHFFILANRVEPHRVDLWYFSNVFLLFQGWCTFSWISLSNCLAG